MKINKHIKINEPSLYILLSLVIRPLSGYELNRMVMRITDGRIDIKTGTMYPTLKKLDEINLIKIVDEENTERNKKIYRITKLGEETLNVELEKLKTKVLEIENILG